MSSQTSSGGGTKTGAAGLAAARARRAAAAAGSSASLSSDGNAAAVVKSAYPSPPPCLVKLRVVESQENITSIPSSSSSFPSASSKVLECLVSKARWLTTPDAVKQVVHVEIGIPSDVEEQISWKPGDSVGILCHNPPTMVEALLQRLLPSLPSSSESQSLTSGDQLLILEPLQFTPPPPASSSSQSPHHLLHIAYPTTLRAILSEHMDLTTIPKRNFLRFLADHCSSKEESSQLLDLSDSRAEKRELYRQEIEEKHPSLLDLLQRFPSCRPPIAHLLSGLLPLQPRLYSITNSCLSTPQIVRLAYTVVEQEKQDLSSSSSCSSLKDVGLCSGWLTSQLEANGLLEHRGRNWRWWPSSPTASSSSSPFRIRLFFKTSSNFVLPHILEENEKPIIMIGPGTGVAPFLSYLDHRRALKALDSSSFSSSSSANSWLFFGCRHPQKDFLYREELEKALEDKLLGHLIVAFSRFFGNVSEVNPGEETEDSSTPSTLSQEVKYVQHRITEYGKELMELMTHQDGRIYVCGDAKGMTKGVMTAFQALIQHHLTTSSSYSSSSASSSASSSTPEEQAKLLFASWMKTGRFIIEAWA